MHMRHMHISIDIITALSFFITDFLLSSVLNGVSALDGGMVTLSVLFVNPLFYIPAICKKIRQASPTAFVWFCHKRKLRDYDGFYQPSVGDIAQESKKACHCEEDISPTRQSVLLYQKTDSHGRFAPSE